MKYLIYVLFGIISGVIGGMGMGGGTLLIPMLTIFLRTNQHVAQAINLVAFIPMSLVAVFIHYKNKLIDFKSILPVILPAILTAILGTLVAKNTDSDLLKKMFGGFLIIIAILQGVLMLQRKK